MKSWMNKIRVGSLDCANFVVVVVVAVVAVVVVVVAVVVVAVVIVVVVVVYVVVGISAHFSDNRRRVTDQIPQFFGLI